MITHFDFVHGTDLCRADLSRPLEIGIPLQNGPQNPNCYWADDPKLETIRMGKFVGSVAEGGPVNYQKFTFSPHGNGTHTECYGHISANGESTAYLVKNFHSMCHVVSIEPELIDGDMVITLAAFKNEIDRIDCEAIAIRTMPNGVERITRKYSGTNPPYLEASLAAYLAKHKVIHLLVDLPSVDKEVDGGALLAHKAFWQFPKKIRKQATITELIYIPNHLEDGLYLLNLHLTTLVADASPSRPILFPIIKLTHGI
jgi:kynurenine formamidase